MYKWCILNLLKYAIKRKGYENNQKEREKSAVIFYLILSTKYLRKCIANNVENFMWILGLKVFTGHPFLQWVVTWVPVDKIVRNSVSLYQVFRLWGQHKKMWTGKNQWGGFPACQIRVTFHFLNAARNWLKNLYIWAAKLLKVTTCQSKGYNLLEI